MSTAVVDRIAGQPHKADVVLLSRSLNPATEEAWNSHPLVPVFIALAISLVMSVAFIGSILAWLALRHTGVMAP